MDIYRPLGAGLFFYETLRILLLVVFLFVASLEGGSASETVNGTFFPYVVYLSSNALFPLMTLFVWLKREEYRNYLPLYIAGKIVALVSFYAWEFFTFREFAGMGFTLKDLFIFWGSVFISLLDILSVWGAWTIKNKSRGAVLPESGGL